MRRGLWQQNIFFLLRSAALPITHNDNRKRYISQFKHELVNSATRAQLARQDVGAGNCPLLLLRPTENLFYSDDTGQHGKTEVKPTFVRTKTNAIRLDEWSGANERHVPAKDIPELGQLI